MKKLLLAILTLVTFTLKAQTSVYHHFPDSSAVWNFHSYVAMSLCPPNGPPIDQYYSITITGDTVINTKTYHKLFTPYIQIVPSTCPPNPIGYKGAVRQDTLAKKVFFVPPTNSVEQLLYDFNMQVGDTVKGFIACSSTPMDTIQSIDSVLVGTTYRKRWNLSSWYNIHFIEGVGSTYGLIEKSPCQTVDFPDYSLTCFIQNGQTLYPNTTTNCYLLTSVTSLNNPNQIKVYPNPTSDQFYIETNATDKLSVDLYDVNGRHVFSKSVSDKSNINVTTLNEGVYTMTIKTVDRVINYKLIILR